MNVTCIALLIAAAGCASAGAELVVSIVDTGAVADGVTLNTEAIQSAIDQVTAAGGGRVVAPRGDFVTGTLDLKDNVELHLDRGARILGSIDPNDYPQPSQKDLLDPTVRNDRSQLALLRAIDAKNIAITGEGEIDGRGLDVVLRIWDLHYEGDPRYAFDDRRPSETLRPKLTRLVGCKDVEVRGVSIRDSACWTLTLERCSDVVIDNVKIDSQAYWNNDGIDLDDCKNVQITNCTVNSADDGICLKSYRRGDCCENIRIADCTVSSRASAVKFGTASYGGFKNIQIDDITINDTYRSAIAIESVDGGSIENIRVSNIRATNTGNAIFVRLGHRAGPSPGTIKGLRFHNIDVAVPFGRPDMAYDLRANDPHEWHNPYPASIVGIPGHPVQDVVIEGLRVTYPGRASKSMAFLPMKRLHLVPERSDAYPEFNMFGELPAWALYVRHATDIELSNATFSVKEDDFRPAIVVDDAQRLRLTKILLPDDASGRIHLKGVTDADLDPATDGRLSAE